MQVVPYKEFNKYLDKSKYKKSLEKVMRYVTSLINEQGLHPSGLELQILGNHLAEMVNRAEKGDKLESVDKKIFAKVSKQSIEIAQKIVDFITENVGSLSESEKYVLSIHFENMHLD